MSEALLSPTLESSPFLVATPTSCQPPQFIMGPWKNFGIKYVINGEMKQGIKDWRHNKAGMLFNAHQTSSKIEKAVETIGGVIHKPFLDPRCPDQIYTADPVLTFISHDGEKIALMSKMRYGVRQGEVSKMRSMLRSAGFRIVESDLIREGSGDAVFDPHLGIWWMGVGERTMPGAGKRLSELSGRPVIEIPTTDPFLYHCDTFMSPLPGGHMVRYPAAMTKATCRIQDMLYPNEGQILNIDKRDAMAFAANLQSLPDTSAPGAQRQIILAPDDLSSKVYDQFRTWGYGVKKISIKSIRAAGGGPHCILQRIWDLREHPLQPLPQHFYATVAKLNEVDKAALKIKIWVDGEPRHSGAVKASQKLKPDVL